MMNGEYNVEKLKCARIRVPSYIVFSFPDDLNQLNLFAE